MIWIKLGILITGFLYAGILPQTLRKVISQIHFNIHEYTLSFMGNRDYYGERYEKGYKWLLFGVAILNYFFFWLLSKFYDLGEYARFARIIDYSFAVLTLLAFVPHNMQPYGKGLLKANIKRFVHNILAGLVFVSLPSLIIFFQYAIFDQYKLLGILGFSIIGIVILVTLINLIKNGITGITELIFINGVSIWTVVVTVLSMIA